MEKNINPDEFKLITLKITKEWIQSSYFIEVNITLNNILNEATKYESKIGFLIEGYDDDPRELWVIDEVKEYFQTLDLLFPYWFYFLHKDRDIGYIGTKEMILLLVPAKIINNTGEVATIELDESLMKDSIDFHFHYLNELTNKLGISIDENKRISSEVLKAIF